MQCSCLLFGKANLLHAHMDALFPWISLAPGSVQGAESGSLWYTVGACCLLCANVKVLVAPPAPPRPPSTSVLFFSASVSLCLSSLQRHPGHQCGAPWGAAGKGMRVKGVQQLLTMLCLQVPPLGLWASAALDTLVHLSLPQFSPLCSGLKAPSDREIQSEVEINLIICKVPYEWALA